MKSLIRIGSLLLAAYAAWIFGLQSALSAVLNPFTRNLVEQALLTGIFLSLAFSVHSTGEVVFFAVWCFIFSNLFENMSVLTGVPFGFFEHSPVTGPRLFNIPWLATPTYMAMGFLSWMVAQVLLDRTERVAWGRQSIGTALVAAFVFSMWDVSNDAVFHTVNGAFWYREAGAFFGVPSSNFQGWLLVTFIIFAGFSLLLKARTDARQGSAVPRGAWPLAVAAYLVVALGSIFRNLTGIDRNVTTKAGATFSSGGIYESMTVVTVFTMVFVSLLAALRLWGGQKPGKPI